MNRDNAYKQIAGRNQPMQLNLSKVLSNSTLTPTPKVGGRGRKGFVLNCVIIPYNDRVFGIYNSKT